MFKGDLIRNNIMRVEDGYHIIRQTMPYPLGENNVYLIENSNGWVIIDVGVDLETTREVWDLAIKEVGISFKHINSIYITHCHPDHLGAARWLQQKCDAPVFMLQEEINRAKNFIFLGDDFEKSYRQAINKEVTLHQFPQRWYEELVKDWHLEVTPLFTEPAELLPLNEGDKINLQGDEFRVIRATGHSDGQYILWCPQRRFLFGADILVKDAYLHFTDWPNSYLTNPLADFFALMDRLELLEEVKVFPGHGPTFDDLGVSLAQLRKRHLRVLDKVEQAVVKPISAGEFYNRMDDLIDYVHLHRVVIGETIGYLNYLVSQKRLDKWQDGERTLFAPRE